MIRHLAGGGAVLGTALVLAACGGNQSGGSGGMAGMEHGGGSQSPAASGQDLDNWAATPIEPY